MGINCGKQNQVYSSRQWQRQPQNFNQIYQNIKNLKITNYITFRQEDEGHKFRLRYNCCLKAFQIIFRKLMKADIKNRIMIQNQTQLTFSQLQIWEQKMFIAAVAYRNKKEMLRTQQKEIINSIERELYTMFRNSPRYICNIWNLIINQSSCEYICPNASFKVATDVLNCSIDNNFKYDFGEDNYQIMLDYINKMQYQDVQFFKELYYKGHIQQLLEIQQNYNYSDLQFFLFIYCIFLAEKKQFYCTINLLNWWVTYKKSIIFESVYLRIQEIITQKVELSSKIKNCKQTSYTSHYDIEGPIRSQQAESLVNQFRLSNQNSHFLMRFISCQEAFVKLYQRALKYLLIQQDRFYEIKINKLTLAIFAYLDKKQMLTNAQKEEINFQQNVFLEIFIQFQNNFRIQEILPIFSGEKSIYYNLEYLKSAKQTLADKILNIQIKNDDYTFDIGKNAIDVLEMFIIRNHQPTLQQLQYYYYYNDSVSISNFLNYGFSKIFMLAVTNLIYRRLKINKNIVLEYCYLFQNIQLFQPFIQKIIAQ